MTRASFWTRVEIDDPGLVLDPALAPHVALGPVQHRKQCAGRQLGLDFRHTVDEPRLARRRHRGAAVPARPAPDAQARGPQGVQRGLAGRARVAVARARQVGSQADDNHKCGTSRIQALRAGGSEIK